MYRLKHQARTRVWLIPLLGLLGGLGLAAVTIAVDRAHHFSQVREPTGRWARPAGAG